MLLCHENGVKVESVPGPCAFSTALAISGMPSGRFTFEGFLSVNKNGRKEHLQSLKNEVRTMIFYEAPHKLTATLNDMYQNFGDRKIAIVREITKIHEEVIHTTLSESTEKFLDNPLKGEIVLIISGAEKENYNYSLEDAVRIADEQLSKGQSKNDAAKFAAKETGIKKGTIYKELL
ncbi:Ribosomal RNA small subunit methyltransferase I [bioreactor metagenome]|uniref:Ribosomal RNA small subunit methyltransferase I n=1 Tax=bioreactor metagenome TaxID=1076179 RepID=A0A645BDY9_9ZZZZ